MSLRTPRRRISPRARRRYRAIRNFFRKTLSSITSMSAIKMNSSGTENVIDLNRADTGHQLHTVRQNYRDIASVGNLYRRHTENLRPTERNSMSNPRQRRFSDRNFEEAETKVLYKTSDNLCTNSYDCGLRIHNVPSDRQHSSDRTYELCSSSHHVPKRIPIKTTYDTACENFDGHGSRFRKHDARKGVENSLSGSESYESLAIPLREPRRPSPGYTRQQDYTRSTRPDEVQIKRRREKPKRYKSKSPHMPNETRRRKKKNEAPANDEHQFIADIINKQYKPFSFFGRKASDISQISTPVCRDQRFSAREMVIPDTDVSSLFQGPETYYRYPCAEGVRDTRIANNSRVDSAPSPPRHRRRRTENYNDSNLYDVVPVKEKTSPKSRRKFIEDSMTPNEVPPSPRTQRPRLILETQNYSDYKDYEPRANPSRRKQSPHRNRRPEYEFINNFRHDVSTDESPQNTNYGMSPKNLRRRNNTTKLQDDRATARSSQQCLTSPNNTTNNTLNSSKIQDHDDTSATDKTDKALCEIKDILQNFLQELKKDSSTSQCDRASRSTTKNSAKQLDGSLHGSGNETSDAMKNTAESSFNCGLGQGSMPAMPPQFIPGFANPCCYPPMIPMYGAHGIPYLVASPSCVCANAGCGHNHPRPQATDTQCRTCSNVNCAETSTSKTNCETDVLIREIYNYVAGNLNVCKKESSKTSQDQSERSANLPRPSMRKSMHALHQDANVGTPPLRCYSKSCEAIVSRQQFDTYYSTYPSYSNSLLGERLSQEAVFDYQKPRETNEYFADKRKPINVPKQQPAQNSKFVSALRLLRKNNKKTRKDVHEICQSEQSIEVEVLPKTRHNFNQEFTTYTMHGQEFLRPPPLRHDPRVPPSYDYDYSPYDSRTARFSNPGTVSDRYKPHYDMPPHSAAPMYDNPYDPRSRHPMQPQVPLCLKEVEVRSIGIQSEGKTTRFRLFPQKKEKLEEPQERPLVSILREDRPKTASVQTFVDTTKEAKEDKPLKFFNSNYKAAASKSEALPSWTDRLQKDITKNDITMSNAMLKKLFYKRNPFSPQNRFVRTIMEKDTPVFKWRPRMFL